MWFSVEIALSRTAEASIASSSTAFKKKESRQVLRRLVTRCEIEGMCFADYCVFSVTLQSF